MADNFAYTDGSGKTFRSDDVAGIHYQVVKLDGGGDGATIPIIAPDATLAAIPVVPRVKRSRLAVTPTVSSGAVYAAKDNVGGIMTFTSAARASGGSGVVRQVTIADKGQQMAALDLVLFSATVAGTATDNATFAPSDADLANLLAVVQIGGMADYQDYSTNSAFSRSVELPYVCAATSLFGVLVARGTPTYTSTTDIVVTLTCDLD